jgi:hypothetical protein
MLESPGLSPQVLPLLSLHMRPTWTHMEPPRRQARHTFIFGLILTSQASYSHAQVTTCMSNRHLKFNMSRNTVCQNTHTQ